MLSTKNTHMDKEWVKEQLKSGPVNVVFTKKDGTERTMKCTTNSELVPVAEKVTGSKKKINEEVCPVYDLEAKHWKSFRWDSLKKVDLSE